MPWKIPLLVLLLLPLIGAGQIAVIDDADGYVNLRRGEGTHTEILRRADDGVAVFLVPDYVYPAFTWIRVRLPKSTYAKYGDNFTDGETDGYVHHSRLLALDSLELCRVDCPELVFQIVAADTSKATDRVVFGLEIPLAHSFEVAGLQLKWRDELITLPDELYDDLYNVAFGVGTYRSRDLRTRTFQRGDKYYIWQGCADGAGSYDIVWVIRDGKIVQRLAGSAT